MTTEELELEMEPVKELSRLDLLVLTCTLGGLQVVWSILNGNINIFLLSIGIPASVSPLIWVIAPVCGTIVQPYTGWLSDTSNSKYGRRKPFILGGTLATVVSLIGLSWSQNTADRVSVDAAAAVKMTAILTVFWVIFLNVSIQPLQMGMRALVMDACPKSQQPQANAWASCAASIGNVLGYLLSFATASASLHVLGLGHFKYLAIIASLCLVATVTVNLWLSEDNTGLATKPTRTLSSMSLLWTHFRHASLVSTRTKIINRVQFCAWMGWFPFLFYMTKFVSDLPPQTSGAEQVKAQPGALAGFLYALISCIGSLLIPQLLRKTSYSAIGVKVASSASVATLFTLPLEEVWCVGQIFFGLLMFSTILATNVTGGILLVAFAGVPWALANYIPFALLGIEVADQRGVKHNSIVVSAQDEEEDGDEAQMNFGTGATIGLHNAAISAPQIVAALLSAGILALADKYGLSDGVGWVMRLSGVAALVAGWNIKRLFIY